MGAGTVRTLLGVKDPKGARIIIWDTKDVSIGRSPENDIVIEDSDSSRSHALLSRVGEEHLVEDLATFNGTLVNGVPVQKQALENRDIIQIADVEITFIQSRKDPGALGLEIVYASQLKGFAGPAGAFDQPDATTLGLVELPPESEASEDEFEVGSVGGFGFSDPESPQGEAVAVDLDPALADMGGNAAATGDAPGVGTRPEGGCVSLRLEIEGLSPDLKRALKTLLGHAIQLPPLRIHLDELDK
jgi:predicted component of type VI protein secretion system